ncbi:MAG: MoaD/ThiS family protein [Deltaproteobacteria bacterium]|nr:MoaD/ThiS family protein [Deltaproteobacteria bacterium]
MPYAAYRRKGHLFNLWQTMQVSVKLFSFFRQYAEGIDQMTVDLAEGSSIADLLSLLSDRFNNSVFKTQKPLVMINNENAVLQYIIKDGDVIYLLPILGCG